MHQKYCLYESLKDGTLDLADVALMHDSIRVHADNEMLYQEWRKPHGQ